jgi:hypothetical protein
MYIPLVATFPNYADLVVEHYYICHSKSVATLTWGMRPRQGLARLWAKKKPRSEGKCEGMNPHIPKGASTLGVWSPGGLSNLQRAIAKVKTQWIEEFFISLEIYSNVDVQISLA